jgi:hypothetical protein
MPTRLLNPASKRYRGISEVIVGAFALIRPSAFFISSVRYRFDLSVVLATPRSWCDRQEAVAMNGIRPNEITADERISEIAEILALGLMRLRTRQSSPLSPHVGESSLDCLGHQSGHADVLKSDGGSV